MEKIKFTVIALILILGISLSYGSCIFAQEKASAREDKIIGLSFKVLVKLYVAASDIDKLKQKGIYKIKKMNKKKFRNRYAEIYNAVKDLPEDFKLEYGITKEKSKKQAITDIKSLDKDKIYKALDDIPDKIIADNFRQYLSQKKEEMQNSSLIEQINTTWNRIIQKI